MANQTTTINNLLYSTDKQRMAMDVPPPPCPVEDTAPLLERLNEDVKVPPCLAEDVALTSLYVVSCFSMLVAPLSGLFMVTIHSSSLTGDFQLQEMCV